MILVLGTLPLIVHDGIAWVGNQLPPLGLPETRKAVEFYSTPFVVLSHTFTGEVLCFLKVPFNRSATHPRADCFEKRAAGQGTSGQEGAPPGVLNQT